MYSCVLVSVFGLQEEPRAFGPRRMA